MATPDVEALMFQVDASVELFKRNMAEAERAMGQLEGHGERTSKRVNSAFGDMGKTLPGLSRGIDGVKASLGGLAAGLGAIGVIGAGRAFLSLADTSKQLRAQLQLATSDFGNFNEGLADVERIASNTRIGLEATTKLYTTMLRTAPALGRTQEDASLAAENFAKALKLGGASAAEASAATLQFSQALASGAFRGDEFNSVAEASPRIMKLLADSLGVPTGALREMAAQGQLTADKLFNALTDTKITAGLNREFAQLPVTFDEAMTKVRDASIIAFGAFDRGGQFSTALANFVSDGADGFAKLTAQAETAGRDVRAAFEGLRTAFEPFKAGWAEAFGIVKGQAYSLRDDIASVLGTIDDMANTMPNMLNAANRAERAVFGRNFLSDDAPLSNLRGDFLRGYDQSANRMTYESIVGGDPFRNVPGYQRSGSTPARTTPAATGGGSSRVSGAGRTTKDAAAALTKEFERQTAALEQQAKVQALRQAGLSTEAEFEQIRYDLIRQMPGLDEARMKMLVDQTQTLAAQKAVYDDMLKLSPETEKRLGEELKGLGEGLPALEQVNARAGELGTILNEEVTRGLQGMMRGFGSLEDVGLNVIFRLGDALIDQLLNPMSQVGGLFGGLGGGGGILGSVIGLVGSLFDKGGYTGDGSPTDIAGMVHKREYVFDAASVARIGVPTLEAIRAGTYRGPDVSTKSLQAAASAGGGGRQEIALRLYMPEGLEARMAEIAAGVSVEVVRAAAPRLQAATVNETYRQLTRQTI